MERLKNGYISAKEKRGVYGLPHSGCINHDNLVKYMKPHGYQQLCITSGIWTHKKCQLILHWWWTTLVLNMRVNIFKAYMLFAMIPTLMKMG